MSRITVRPASPGDIDTVTAIYRAAVLTGTASFEVALPSATEMRARFRSIVEAGYPYLVAVMSDRIVGFGYLSAYRPRAADRYTVENSIYVAPDVHRRGVGRHLLSALVDQAIARGDRQMVAVIGDPSQSGSVALHRGFGFAHAGRLHGIGHKQGRWLDVELMQRALEADGAPPAERVDIARERPDQPDIRDLLAAADAFAHALYPPASNHLLDVSHLLSSEVCFLVARLSGTAVGCGAYLDAGDGSVEIKRMWVDPAARGGNRGPRGGGRVGAAILARLETVARANGATVARLETGIHNHAALRLYAAAGYAAVGPFGSYRADPLSVFMAKRL